MRRHKPSWMGRTKPPLVKIGSFKAVKATTDLEKLCQKVIDAMPRDFVVVLSAAFLYGAPKEQWEWIRDELEKWLPEELTIEERAAVLAEIKGREVEW